MNKKRRGEGVFEVGEEIGRVVLFLDFVIGDGWRWEKVLVRKRKGEEKRRKEKDYYL